MLAATVAAAMPATKGATMGRRAVCLLMVVFLAATALAGGVQERNALVTQLDVKLQLLAGRLSELEQHQSDLEQAWSRVEHLSSDLIRAHREGETLDSLKLRDADLRLAEAELLMHVAESQRLRGEVAALRSEVDVLRQRLEETGKAAGEGDPLTGRWKLAVEPGGLEGYADLELNGTLVTGVYHLSGGWYGSLKGTLVAGKVRLERIDSQLGFAAIFYGRLFTDEDPPRLQGTWEGTNLSAGLPSSGTWVATRVPERSPGTD